MTSTKLISGALVVLVLASCGGGGGGGGGSASNETSVEGLSTSTAQNSDVVTSSNATGNNADPANDLSANTDSDGDGVSDLLDVAPDDASVTKAIQFNLRNVDSLGFGQALNASVPAAITSTQKAESPIARLANVFLRALFPEAHAEADLAALTNTIAWDANGDVVAPAILASEPLFIAEAAVSPDGKYVYLLTSNHIQRALPALGSEVCSIYRVQLEDLSFACLLSTSDGDIEPKSLIITQSTDFSRRGMSFRSDGAALMQGFDWNADLPDGVSGGTQSTKAWFMDSQGSLTPITPDYPYYAIAVFWLTDDSFAVAEFANTDNLEAGMTQERFAIYSAETLQRTNLISDGVTNFGLPMVQMGNDVFWDSYVLRGGSLLIEDSGGEGYPLLDPVGERMLFLVDYIQSQRDPQIANSDRNRIFSIDGSVRLELSAGAADWYERTKQSGTGTDIKYPPIGMSTTHIAYRKSFEPAEPIQTIEGQALARFETYQLSGFQGTLEVEAARDIFIVRPDAEQTGDLTFSYDVLTATNSTETRQITIPQETVAEARASGDEYIQWASPSPQREGFCVYQFDSDSEQCVNFDEHRVVAVDAQYFSGNSPPGVQNTLLVGQQIRVYFKDSTDGRYYKAEASVSSFMEQGYEALEITPAVNGAGDANIVSDAINMTPPDPKPLEGVTVRYDAANMVVIDFGQSISQYAALPSFALKQGNETIEPVGDVSWDQSRRTASLTLDPDLLVASEDVTVEIVDPLFLPNQSRQYRLAENLVFQIE